LLYNFALKDILDLTVKNDGISNLARVVMFSMYLQSSNICPRGEP